jgi:large-conductance mechanosensitive channel
MNGEANRVEALKSEDELATTQFRSDTPQLAAGSFIMEILNFVIVLVALIIAVMAFQRTGGIKDLRKSTAELLVKMEKKMREEEAAKVEKGKTQK